MWTFQHFFNIDKLAIKPKFFHIKISEKVETAKF